MLDFRPLIVNQQRHVGGIEILLPPNEQKISVADFRFHRISPGSNEKVPIDVVQSLHGKLLGRESYFFRSGLIAYCSRSEVAALGETE